MLQLSSWLNCNFVFVSLTHRQKNTEVLIGGGGGSLLPCSHLKKQTCFLQNSTSFPSVFIFFHKFSAPCSLVRYFYGNASVLPVYVRPCPLAPKTQIRTSILHHLHSVHSFSNFSEFAMLTLLKVPDYSLLCLHSSLDETLNSTLDEKDNISISNFSPFEMTNFHYNQWQEQ